MGVAHRTREKVTSHTPVHINFKYKTFIQTARILEILSIGFQNAFKHHFYVIHFTLQSNHIHIIAETKDNETLIKGMRSLTNTIVKRIDMGALQVERYHLHVLRTPQETSNAVSYVQDNEFKHTGKTNKKFSGKFLEGKCWLLRTISS